MNFIKKKCSIFINKKAVNAGRPTQTQSVDMCSVGDQASQIKISTSILLNSPAFPKYPTVDSKCIREIVAPTGFALKIYVLTALFKGSEKK